MKKILFFLLTVSLLSSCGRRYSKDRVSDREEYLFNRYLLSKHYAVKLKKTYEAASDQFFEDVDRELAIIDVLFRRVKREIQEIENFKSDFSSIAFQIIEAHYSSEKRMDTIEKRIAAIEKKIGIEDTAEEDAAPDETPENDGTTSTDDAPTPVVTETAPADDDTEGIKKKLDIDGTTSTDGTPAPVVTETVPAESGTASTDAPTEVELAPEEGGTATTTESDDTASDAAVATEVPKTDDETGDGTVPKD